jgi:hypothetical protein
MTKILEEVRAISSEAIAKKQDSAKNNYPKLIEQIKKAAQLGKTQCEFSEYEIDQYAKKLLEVEGFCVWATTRSPNEMEKYMFNGTTSNSKSIWVVRW